MSSCEGVKTVLEEIDAVFNDFRTHCNVATTSGSPGFSEHAQKEFLSKISVSLDEAIKVSFIAMDKKFSVSGGCSLVQMIDSSELVFT